MARTGSAGADREDGGAWGMAPSGVDLAMIQTCRGMVVIGFGLVIVGGTGLAIGVGLRRVRGRWLYCMST